MLKKFVSIFLVFMLTLSLGITSFAKEVSEEQVRDTMGNTLVEIKLNPNDLESVKRTLAENHIGERETDDILKRVNMYLAGEIKNLEISVFVPNAKTRGQYLGYNNKYYYEDIVRMSQNSDVIAVNSGSNLDKYMNGTAKAFVNYVVDSVMDSATGGSWSIASLFTNIPDNTIGTTSYEHCAALKETKWTKYTYYIDNGQQYMGSTVEKTQYSFQNMLSIAGEGYYNQGSTTTKTWTADSWNYADEKAYYHWLNGGYYENIRSYTYQGTDFDSL